MEETKEQIGDYFKMAFLNGEASYRSQPRKMPRFAFGEKIRLVDVVNFFLNNDVTDYLASLSICRTGLFGGTEETRFINDAREVCNYDLLNAVTYIGKDGKLYPRSGENVTLTFTYNDGQAAVLFVRNMSNIPDILYIRVYYMINTKKDADDMRSINSGNLMLIAYTTLSVMTSINDIDELLEFYAENEEKFAEALQNGRLEDSYQETILEGVYGALPTWSYPNDGDHFFALGQYYDAQVKYDRALQAMNDPSQNMEAGQNFGEVNSKMYQCLVKTNDLARAFYYSAAAAYFNADTTAGSYWIISRLFDYRTLSIVENNKKSIPAEELPLIMKAYGDAKTSLKEKLRDEPGFLTMGFLLHTLLRMEKDNILAMNVCRNINGEYRYERVGDKDDVWKYPVSKVLYDGNTIVFRYSRAGYECDIENDKSKLCHDNSIIMQVKAIDGADKMRVDVVVPAFIDDPDNYAHKPRGCADYKSVIISATPHEYDFSQRLHYIYNEACALYNENNNCVLEALLGLFRVYQFLQVHFDELDDLGKNMCLDSAAKIGSGFMELGMMDVAYYYLHVGVGSARQNNIMEFVNCLVNMKSVMAMPVIDHDLLTPSAPETPTEVATELKAFLRRRKAYVLIDWGRIDEAKSFLQELVKDPQCEDFAIGELAYIEKLEKKTE